MLIHSIIKCYANSLESVLNIIVNTLQVYVSLAIFEYKKCFY